MPSSATVTTYHSFVQRTRAKASEVNTNFSNHRGHNLPIDPNTATTANNTYDLGASDAQWRNAYFQNTPRVANVQLNKFEIPIVFDGTSPPSYVDPIGPLNLIAFPGDRDSDVDFHFTVPPEYRVGQRIALVMKGYPETTGSSVFYSTTYLHRVDTTNITGTSTPSSVLTSTATLANSVAGLLIQDATLKLTDASGLVNGATVSVGDILAVNFKRAAVSATGDTNTGRWFLETLHYDLNN